MPLIFVTLDVSRCSGWLKADAPCRFTTGLSGQGIPGDRGYQGLVAGGHGGCAGARSVCTEDPDWTLGGTAREGAAHVEHIVHVRIPGRVETQRLVERRRLLPRVTPRHMRRATQGGGRREGVWGACGGRWRCTQRARRSRLDIGHAHLEHPAHARDAGRVEAQRLVERRRLLPRVTRRHMEGDTPGEQGGRAWGWKR